ncbi:MAG: hypothetical protein KJO91_08345 [Gammaproteobacteria bacterium]|nr:hypothetical protein [Gammaproteobacteria bacterium]
MTGEGRRISRERARLIRRQEGLQVVRKRRKRKILGITTQWDSKLPRQVDSSKRASKAQYILNWQLH